MDEAEPSSSKAINRNPIRMKRNVASRLNPVEPIRMQMRAGIQSRKCCANEPESPDWLIDDLSVLFFRFLECASPPGDGAGVATQRHSITADDGVIHCN